MFLTVTSHVVIRLAGGEHVLVSEPAEGQDGGFVHCRAEHGVRDLLALAEVCQRDEFGRRNLQQRPGVAGGGFGIPGEPRRLDAADRRLQLRDSGESLVVGEPQSLDRLSR